jgi:two-component system, NarL family, response regulator LiaR
MDASVAQGAMTALIADDKEIMRIGFRELLTQSVGYQHIAEVADGWAAVEKALALRPGIAVVKRDLPGLDGVAVVQEIKRVAADIPVLLVLTSVEQFWPALGSDADGYIVRDLCTGVFCDAVRTVAAGRKYLGPAVCEHLLKGQGLSAMRVAAAHLHGAPGLETLSPREKDVLRLMTEGQSNELIAGSLGLSIQTVKVHVKHILRKLKVSDRTQAVIKALRNGY